MTTVPLHTVVIMTAFSAAVASLSYVLWPWTEKGRDFHVVMEEQTVVADQCVEDVND